ncbi:related to PRP38A-pre-mRNA-splicing factor [Ustilago bromivora]|uniref:Pre-mRNA-splicing factor 38 n=1 Tax=Ustilago bromivora TaxID=307758 RepID=A0A1K0G7P0_9BASI|nr:related to PRP38A-pre-mRNA-splicing factor [Ustilago bromivora]SYW73802.1 related to PRP38A - pre-mRNA-splicing factor [Ustilago bromivora]
MANATIRKAVSIHGTNPQHLIEKTIRYRIYESPFWKEHCFALSSSTILPLAVSLHHIGGLVGLQRPSHFLCLVQKLLQIQPEHSVIKAYLDACEFKYLRALTAFYIRLTCKSTEVYQLLEPILEDGRKLRWRRGDGGYEVLHMDEWVDMLLREERVCDIILPRLSKREVCQVRDGLAPRISKLETCLIRTLESNHVAEEEGQESDGSLSDLKRWKLQKLQQATRRAQIKTSPSPPSRQNFGLEEYTSQEESDQQMAERKRRRLISPSYSVSPDRQLSPSTALEEGEEERGYVSRSPSRSPDRNPSGYLSRSPSLSPDRT